MDDHEKEDEMATVDFDGVELFYERSGSGDRVVMTHGAWRDGRAWQAVTEHLTDRFEIVVGDRRATAGAEIPMDRGAADRTRPTWLR